MSTEEDVYKGYRIPKGSLILANLWYFLHNPDTYHDPNTFNPERHLPYGDDGREAEQDPRLYTFGFGRR